MSYILIKNGKIYNPNYHGKADILMINDKIVKIAEDISVEHDLFDVEVIDAMGKVVVPGFIDQHVHLIGGGGELGFYSRTPEVVLSDLVQNGITTVVGLLGTDGETRHIESLLAKAHGLEHEGITTFIHTGSYTIPSVTITGSVKKDIMFIDKVIGVKVALADHRSSQMADQEIIRLASEARVAGMLSGKSGMVHIHVGSGGARLDQLLRIVEETDIPITQFMPTHVSRTKALLEQAIQFAQVGGRIDISTYAEVYNNDEITPSDAVVECFNHKVPVENITISSDGNGSLPVYNENSNIIGLDVGKVDTLYTVFKHLVTKKNIDLADALKIVTSNVAKAIGAYPQKGLLKEGSDADIVILNEQTLNIEHVFAKGQQMVKDRQVIVKGTFE
ncbi:MULTISPECIES: beta-aspartyl-peptidase [Bacillaceae]|uniref:beta-aspartyl-peptidase n=1 Tax=Bacillaceae TaxID=186817 RepID=UPI002A123FB0|nr:beta-aspartyl-peptidase [Cytobacillus sp. IB215316]MDX8362591.1 beta-aspartyl-peptidase [Cytobacillus sp. IB215316]